MLTRALSALAFGGLILIVGIQLGISHGRQLTSASSSCELTRDWGEWVYLKRPDVLMRGIRAAEGVPSYGLMNLAAKYGSHQNVPQDVGRYYAGKLLHRFYREWHERSSEDFLTYLGSRWAPPAADPLNGHWLRNVQTNIAWQFINE